MECSMGFNKDCEGEIKMEASNTMYVYDGVMGDENDPNKDIPLCRLHAKEHHEYWDEMWAEYNPGRI